MSKTVYAVALYVNAAPKSRVWGNHMHGSVGAGMALKVLIINLVTKEQVLCLLPDKPVN